MKPCLMQIPQDTELKRPWGLRQNNVPSRHLQSCDQPVPKVRCQIPTLNLLQAWKRGLEETKPPQIYAFPNQPALEICSRNLKGKLFEKKKRDMRYF